MYFKSFPGSCGVQAYGGADFENTHVGKSTNSECGLWQFIKASGSVLVVLKKKKKKTHLNILFTSIL